MTDNEKIVVAPEMTSAEYFAKLEAKKAEDAKASEIVTPVVI